MSILVFGHKNPDTDTICSAIAYAELKGKLGKDVKAVRLGEVNEETKFVLDYFKVEKPELIEMKDSKMAYITLNTGAKMPLEGFGVFQISDAAQCEEVVYNAIKSGYRLLDTAAAYANEEVVGKGVARAIADRLTTREELFITTKV